MKDTSLCPNNSILFHLNIKHTRTEFSFFVQMSICKGQAGFCVPWKSGPVVCSIRWTVCLETLPPAEPRFTRMALVMILGFFFTSLTILLASTGVTFGFRSRPLVRDFPQCETFCSCLIILCTVATGAWGHLDMALWPFPDLWEATLCRHRSSVSSFVQPLSWLTAVPSESV